MSLGYRSGGGACLISCTQSGPEGGYKPGMKCGLEPPTASPDLNPIEMPYSKFKTFLRKVAARTVPGLNRAIRSF